MYKFNLKAIYPALALLVLIFALSVRKMGVPPLGIFLDPFVGAVQSQNEKDLAAAHLSLRQRGVTDSVHVFFDERLVPHIYANNAEDLYFAQGYITARLRLWQMDFLSYASAGRLSEILGNERALNYDRNQRRLGLLNAAKQSLALIEKSPATHKALSAYTKGVNSYIRQLKHKDLPLEYKLLDYAPEPWTELKSVLILKQMANTLSGYEEDATMSKLMLILGEEPFNKLYPDYNSHSTPVMNDEPGFKNGQNKIGKPPYLNPAFMALYAPVSKSPYNPQLGSNSWVVSGKRTRSGHPLLANDIHLSLTLPCVWLEMQLSSPGLNVYGATLPGLPAVIVGFNEHIAWGITNGADDVKDWFKLKMDGPGKKYEFDGKWLDLDHRVEEIGRRGEKPFYDTVFSSVHGPVVYDEAFKGPQPELAGHALKWELHNPSNELLTFIELNRSKNFKDYLDALKHYHCPVVNFSYAGKDSTIAIHHRGNMPLKFPGQGKFIGDGTKSSGISSRYIPQDSLPHLINPACGFVLSANQHPTYSSYPYYYNGYYSEVRANQIQKRLYDKSDLDVQSTMSIQLDNTSSFAQEALPALLKSVDTVKLNARQKGILKRLGSWKGAYDLDDTCAKIYDLWWNQFKTLTWDELAGEPSFLKLPDDYVLLDLIRNEPLSEYFNTARSPGRESGPDIVTSAFIKTLDELVDLEKRGRKKWGDFNKVRIMHLADIKAFSSVNRPSGGHPLAINATSESWGPTWRMIVELGDRPKAYGIYPGGQSGTIGSPYYDNFIKDWSLGKYYSMELFSSIKEAQEKARASWLFEPGKN